MTQVLRTARATNGVLRHGEVMSAQWASTAVRKPPSELAPRRVFVTVGSDHHRFDRLVRWVDGWAASRGLGPADVLVQHGPAAPPASAAGVDFVPHDLLLSLMHAADVVVSQGGPMSILEARQQGRRPVVLPRTAALHEVVDDHQHAFCVRIARDGWIDLVADEPELHAALDAALAAPELSWVVPDPTRDQEIAASIARFARTADGVLAATAARRRAAVRRGARRSDAASGVALAADDPKVLLLGGFGRSGSTLLERALGDVPNVVAVGEALHLWERGLRDDERCGCGRPFSSCPYWGKVGKLAYGGWSDIDAATAVDDRLSVVRNRNIPELVVGVLSPTRRLRTSRLRRRVGRLYAAARDVTGSSLIIDSSKHPAYAFLLRGCRVSLSCVLVVRDPRGVAYSWSKTVARPEATDCAAEMPRYGAFSASLRWSLYGALFHSLRLLRVPVKTVRYEDLIADPRGTVESVLRFAGQPVSMSGLGHLHADTIDLGVHHTVAGNPMRFMVGPTALRLDEAWRHQMPAGRRRLVAGVTALLRRHYGYR